jgi:hypothetical protein
VTFWSAISAALWGHFRRGRASEPAHLDERAKFNAYAPIFGSLT